MAQVRKSSSTPPTGPTKTKTVLEQDSHDQRPSSAGSIKRINTKIRSEGLIVLPPERGLVQFESADIPRPASTTDCLSAVRGGSAGRVEKSLQLARKKELEDVIPRRNSAGPDFTANGMTGSSVISAAGELRQQERTSIPQQQTVELHTKDSESSDTESSDGDDKNSEASTETAAAAAAAAAEAPVELKGEFLKSVMDEDYEKAKELCQKILLLEPDNKTCSEFHAVIVEKMRQEDEDSDGSDESTEESDESDQSQESSQESSQDEQDDDDDDDESNSDDDFTLPSGPINLIMGGLPIRPQNR